VVGNHTHVRVYECHACHHEMRLTVWGAEDLTPTKARVSSLPDFLRPDAAKSAQGADR
jgi:hypothetical protein